MNIIACCDMNCGIGYKNDLLFNIPQDKKYFKNLTVGKTIVMGRKTFESLPVKPLPERENIVLSQNPSFSYKGVTVFHSTDNLFSYLRGIKTEDIFIIGGEEIYNIMLPYCETAFITQVYEQKKADKFIIDFENSDEWVPVSRSEIFEQKGIKFRFSEYRHTAVKNIFL